MKKLILGIATCFFASISPAHAAALFDLRFFNVDDTMTANITNSDFSDQKILEIGFSQNNPYVDISSFVRPGSNTLAINLFNGPSGYTYGYDFRKDGVSIASGQCGIFNTFGCDNDSYAQGLVFTRNITFDGGTAQPVPEQAVPEPATWLMMLLGFGVIGCAMRAKRNQTLRVRYT